MARAQGGLRQLAAWPQIQYWNLIPKRWPVEGLLTVADRLARSSLSSPPGVHLFSQPPEEIRRELEDDLAGVPVSHP
nr:hypothetical protein Iba_chr12dCG8320 [Ipomoea batatas]